MTKDFPLLPTALSTKPSSCLFWNNPLGLLPPALALTASPACISFSDPLSPFLKILKMYLFIY